MQNDAETRSENWNKFDTNGCASVLAENENPGALASATGADLHVNDELTCKNFRKSPRKASRRHRGLPTGMKKSDLVDILDRLRVTLGLKPRHIAYVRHVVKWTQPQDYEAGHLCGIWHSAATLAEELGVTLRTLNRTENELISAGIILRTSEANRQRSGDRATGDRPADKTILHFSGIGPSPLIDRAAWLAVEVKAQTARLREVRELHQELRLLARQINASEDEQVRYGSR